MRDAAVVPERPRRYTSVMHDRFIVAAVVAAALACAACAPAAAGTESGGLAIVHRGARPSLRGPAASFTGAVRVDPLFQPTAPTRAAAAYVTFEPGARSAWHKHPLGQTLVVTAGTGRIQRRGGPVQELNVGDVVYTPPDVVHWHGASPTTAMTHLAITEQLDGKSVEWLEQVTDAEYLPQVARPDTSALDDLRAVSPALAAYTETTLRGDVWNRPGLSPRDRSLVTVAAVIARNQAGDMASSFERALDHGVTPGELSEIITHLAFYSGWPNAMAAVTAAQPVFAKRGIRIDQLPPATGPLLPLDRPAEDARKARVDQLFATVAPGVLTYTTDLLFLEVWQRPGLAQRDRSLVTVSALIAAGQVAQLPNHLNLAMDRGLTKDQTAEVLLQLAFDAGWPNIFSALPVVKDVLARRPQ